MSGAKGGFSMADLQGGRKALNNVQAPAEAKAGGKDEGTGTCGPLRNTACIGCT